MVAFHVAVATDCTDCVHHHREVCTAPDIFPVENEGERQCLQKAEQRRVGGMSVFIVLQILLRRLDSDDHRLRQLRKQSFLTTTSGCLRLAPTERNTARDQQAEHYM